MIVTLLKTAWNHLSSVFLDDGASPCRTHEHGYSRHLVDEGSTWHFDRSDASSC